MSNAALERYEAGLLSDYGGGNVEWWHDYIRAELDHAHYYYQSQMSSSDDSAQDAETREGLLFLASELEAFHDCADGHVFAGNGHFRLQCSSESEQQRLNLRAVLREAATAIRTLASQSPAQFHGAQCPTYPNCTGGCGLGCTKEHAPAASEEDELGLRDLGESFLAEYERAVKDGCLKNFVCAESPVEVLWHLINELDELRLERDQTRTQLEELTAQRDALNGDVHQLGQQVEGQKRVLDWVRAWVDNPADSYAPGAVNGFFLRTSDMIDALSQPITSDGAAK